MHDSLDNRECDLLGKEILDEIVQPAFARAVCAILDLNPLTVSSPPFPLLLRCCNLSCVSAKMPRFTCTAGQRGWLQRTV